MRIAVSGTPGTGKTTTARLLARRLGVPLIRIRDVIDEIPHARDTARNTFVVDTRDLQHLIRKKLGAGSGIVEGHLAHLLDVAVVIILRTNPRALAQRLRRKGWKKTKITENVHAEILDAATIEALEKHGRRKVFEIDTTGKRATAVAGIMAMILNKQGNYRNYRVGRIDWSERYKEMLVR